MRLVRGFTATPAGCVPARIVAITLFVRPRITDTVLLALLATYTVLVPGFAATAMGLPPTRMKAVTLIPPPPPWPVLPAADAGECESADQASAHDRGARGKPHHVPLPGPTAPV